ncbi:MAG: GNAT family N-acetyltransferase [Chitinophagales bacterium]
MRKHTNTHIHAYTYTPARWQSLFNMNDEIKILDYRPEYAKYFLQLNKAWIEKYFVMETSDHVYLNDPQKYIIDEGGDILFAEYNGAIIGCCALIKSDIHLYELSKMAVDPSAQGKHIGLKLGEAIIERAKTKGAKKIFLNSNTILTSAINLYKKMGFKEVPLDSGLYTRSNIQMELQL